MDRQERRVQRLRKHVLSRESEAMKLSRQEGIRQHEHEYKNQDGIAINEEEVPTVEEYTLPEFDDITIKDIKEILDDREIEYSDRANKSELYELLPGSD